MEKIFNYIRHGKGQGILFLLAAAVLTTIILMSVVKQFYADFRPQLLSAGEQILPITIQNGKVVEPLNAYKSANIKFSEDDNDENALVLVLDTRDDAAEPQFDRNGIFITKDIVYFASPNKIQRVTMRDGVWDKQKAEEVLDYFSGALSLIISVLLVAFLFLVLLVKTLFVSVIARMGLKMAKHQDLFHFSALMRLSAVVVAVVETLSFIVGFLSSFAIAGFPKFTIELILVWLFLFKETKNRVC